MKGRQKWHATHLPAKGGARFVQRHEERFEKQLARLRRALKVRKR